MQDIIPFFILFAGYIIGLGAVTVIDIHGFLGRKSIYWTEATIRTHKVTKPLIWLGMTLKALGDFFVYHFIATSYPINHMMYINVILVLNGLFLSFYVSPLLLRMEKSQEPITLLPNSLQLKITLSFIVSFLGWWGSLYYLTQTLSGYLTL